MKPLFVRTFTLALVAAALAQAAQPTEFYVDPDYGGAVKNGSAATPWTRLDASPTGAVWAAINGALAAQDVTVYFSARNAADDTNQISTFGVNLARTDTSPHRLTLDGMSKYNANDAAPSWAEYRGSSRLEIRYGYPLSAHTPGANQDHVTIRGFKAIGGYAGYGGQALVYWGGSHVLIENCEFTHDPSAKHGACVQFGYAWNERGTRQNGGCTDISIRNNVIHDTFGEAIYIGGSGNTRDPATGKVYPSHSGVLIEGNVIYNVGNRGGEGDCIDIKDGLTHVTIRNNTCHHTQGGNAAGISSLSQFTAERNVIYSVAGHGISFGTYWGSGFAGAVIRGNLIFSNAKSGVNMSSDSGKPVADTLIVSNTVYGNRGAGLVVGVNPGGTITHLQVKNNIFMGNASGISGWGRATYTITQNDFHGNRPDYASPFRPSDDPKIAGQNISADPQFTNASSPAGPDGKFFTADDGFVPQSGSVVSRSGEGGTHLGALPPQRKEE